MKAFSILAFFILLSVSCFGQEEKWRSLLNKPVDDEWQQILGVAISQKEDRAPETLASKIVAIQKLIRQDYGHTIPVFVPPSFGVELMDAIPATQEIKTGLPVTKVPSSEVFRYIAGLIKYRIIVTDIGVVFCANEKADTAK